MTDFGGQAEEQTPKQYVFAGLDQFGFVTIREARD